MIHVCYEGQQQMNELAKLVFIIMIINSISSQLFVIRGECKKEAALMFWWFKSLLLLSEQVGWTMDNN